MEGWAFAAVALVVVLGFELVLFRYFTPERPAAASPDDASERSGTRGAGGSVRAGGHAAGTDRDEAGTVVCEACGTANADAPAVVFCRACLGRLR
ncbi:DUF7577 domain-containing protein [Halosimplex halobium]|uniref:DUF7577 domain-containing protein n=1 Tax=Halosimplex halobium TaxID=3396618 RepID=UPI003F567A34